MKRSNLYLCLLVITLGTGLAISGWFGWALLGSRPVQAQEVLGASTAAEQVTALPYPVQIGGPSKPNIQARYYAVYNPQSGKLLAGKDETAPVPIASTTKMMTTYLIARMGNLDDVVTISQEAGTINGSIMGLRPGEKITVHDLLMGALMVSGNDAATSLAEYGGGLLLKNQDAPRDAKVARFVQEMNTMAATLDMMSTKYQDPVGLNDEGHSSALDLAKLTHHTIENDIIKSIVGTATATVWNTTQTIRHDLRNSNKLVADYFYDGVIGGKTGFTPAAGHCLISAAKRDGLELIVVVLNTYADTLNASADATKVGLDWGFANWKLQ
jgi:D-alanyl-D-alanine carboxypeptidase (penicillin-binding protein 5/6)